VGVHDENEYHRFYPGGDGVSHVVGFTGDHDVGQEGMELAQQDWLAGKAGARRVIINRRGEAVEDVASIRAPQEGHDLALAIDTRLQYLAFRELKAAVEANKAKAGGLVIIDTETGEIVALANWPAYNPNNHGRTARDRMRNRALTDTFEPGSTLKPFTIAAALEAGKVRPDTVIQTAPGSFTIGTATIHDAHREGALTVEQVIQKSSNIGDVLGVRLRCAAAHRLSGRGVGTAAAGEELAPHRAGDDGVRPRHLGQSRAACACVHHLRG
jgi:cell division protein FtsI (penicillin-binding protein 3)